MSNEDKEHLRAIYAGLAMMGLIQKSVYPNEMVVSLSFDVADLMMEHLNPQEGIVKARRKKVG